MMTFTFTPTVRLIVFNVGLAYRLEWTVKMALDTGASTTLITPEAATMIGFDLNNPSLRKEKITAASQPEQAVKLILPKLIFYREIITNHPVVCSPLPKELGVSGLLGLNFMREFRITLDFLGGSIAFERRLNVTE